jgi:hypothetical protein
MKKILLAILSPLVFVSCEDQLNVTLPYDGNRFVLYSELSPNKVVDIKVERTYPPTGKFDLDNTFQNTTKVELYENEKWKETLVRNKATNMYISPSGYKPVVGKSYYFKVKADGFQDAKSKPQIIPNPIEVSSVGFSDEKVTSPLNVSSPTKLLKIKFKKVDQDNLYVAVEITGRYNEINTSNNIISTKSPAEFGDPCIYDLASYLKIYNTKCYNKEENEITFYIEMLGYTELPKPGEKTITDLKIKLSIVSSFYYDYISTYNPPDGIFKAFQPINPTLTNIENGFGAVLGKNENVIYYKIP